tara:strand:- start:129 stop:236 length:108 start_codon:yes stop_codon:yes gene_type:complete
VQETVANATGATEAADVVELAEAVVEAEAEAAPTD